VRLKHFPEQRAYGNIEYDHELKITPQMFGVVMDGTKTFEFRSEADRHFEEGQLLFLREWTEKDSYSGKHLFALVMYVLRGPDFGVPTGFACMSIVVVDEFISVFGETLEMKRLRSEAYMKVLFYEDRDLSVVRRLRAPDPSPWKIVFSGSLYECKSCGSSLREAVLAFKKRLREFHKRTTKWLTEKSEEESG